MYTKLVCEGAIGSGLKPEQWPFFILQKCRLRRRREERERGCGKSWHAIGGAHPGLENTLRPTLMISLHTPLFCRFSYLFNRERLNCSSYKKSHNHFSFQSFPFYMQISTSFQSPILTPEKYYNQTVFPVFSSPPPTPETHILRISVYEKWKSQSLLLTN